MTQHGPMTIGGLMIHGKMRSGFEAKLTWQNAQEATAALRKDRGFGEVTGGKSNGPPVEREIQVKVWYGC